jgi:threonine dehydrogenase-like Zn-dependent dehydrogenase
MRALVFGVPPEPFDVPEDANTLTHNLAHSPVGLCEVSDPLPLREDWVITRPRLTGICGSDSK